MIADVIYEFIPEEDIGKSNPKTLLIDGVELGENYELVITQMWGLYRYRFGDVVQVSGFYRNCPTVKFMYRTGTLLNLVGGKVDQVTISASLNSALSKWIDVEALRQYWVAESTLLAGLMPGNEDTTFSDSGGSASHYVFFLEIDISGKSRSDLSDLRELARQIDENIYSRHSCYRVFKDDGRIAPPKVLIVPRIS